MPPVPPGWRAAQAAARRRRGRQRPGPAPEHLRHCVRFALEMTDLAPMAAASARHSAGCIGAARRLRSLPPSGFPRLLRATVHWCQSGASACGVPRFEKARLRERDLPAGPVCLIAPHNSDIMVRMKRSIPDITVTKKNPTRKKPGPPRTTGPGEPVLVRLQQPLLGNIDAWSAAQADAPTRAKSLRRLAEAGLAATRAKPKKKPRPKRRQSAAWSRSTAPPVTPRKLARRGPRRIDPHHALPATGSSSASQHSGCSPRWPVRPRAKNVVQPAEPAIADMQNRIG